MVDGLRGACLAVRLAVVVQRLEVDSGPLAEAAVAHAAAEGHVALVSSHDVDAVVQQEAEQLVVVDHQGDRVVVLHGDVADGVEALAVERAVGGVDRGELGQPTELRVERVEPVEVLALPLHDLAGLAAATDAERHLDDSLPPGGLQVSLEVTNDTGRVDRLCGLHLAGFPSGGDGERNAQQCCERNAEDHPTASDVHDQTFSVILFSQPFLERE